MNKKTIIITVIVCFLFSALFSLNTMKREKNETASTGPQQLGKFCVSQIYPAADWEADKVQTEKENKIQITKTIAEAEKKNLKVDNSKPEVIIYHTHSSESYQPYTAGNFHRESEEGTVREVGNVMAQELNNLGVSVVHDKTIHDRPSYNESYERSMETITSLINKYPSAKVIIDLHRDAAAYTGNVGETMEIDGQITAKYKFVVGQANDNYSELMAFAKEVNKAADELYPGFSGRIIEKEYNYNEYISDKYLLLEVGNNQNNIKEVRNTGKYFARVLAQVLEE